MLAWLRGQSTPIEVPDQPAPSPQVPSPQVTTPPVQRFDAGVTSTQATTDHAGTDTMVDHAGAGVTWTLSSSDSFPSFPGTHDSAVTFTPLDTHAGTGGASIVNNPAVPAIQWFAHSDALPSFAPVPGVVTDISAPGARGGDLLGDSGGSGDARGRVFRGGDTLASLAIDSSGYGDHGWFIVPSASAEYGDAHFDVAGADGFAFNVAAGEFTSDWFLV